MAWDTEQTQAKLKAAAVVEFAAHGLSGTRVEAIAERAGINKERIYKYFGSKEQLFGLVLAEELARIASAVPILGPTPDDIGDYAGRCFDYHCAHPELVRLLHWEALELSAGDSVPEEATRAADYRHKVAAFAAAQSRGQIPATIDPGDLLFVVMSTAAWWVAVPQVARMITGRPDSARGERARRRASVVAAAKRLGEHGS
jgi:AcrR family transcriptional regulator